MIIRLFLIFYACIVILFNQVALSNGPLQVFEGHAYEYISESMSWNEAKVFAEKRGGNLVEINSFQENEFVKNFLSAIESKAPDGGNSKFAWLGGSDLDSEGIWMWNSGLSINLNKNSSRPFWGNGPGFVNGENEPDNSHGRQDCLAIGVEGWPEKSTDLNFLGKAGQWNDLDCDNFLAFAIEYDVETSLIDDSYLTIPLIVIEDKKYQMNLQLYECPFGQDKKCFMVLSSTQSNMPLHRDMPLYEDGTLKLPRVRVESPQRSKFNYPMYFEMVLEFDANNYAFGVRSWKPAPSLNTYPGQIYSLPATGSDETDEWLVTAPERVGMNPDGIQESMDYAFNDGQNTQAVLIVKNGAIVSERYAEGSDKNSIATSWSTAKSFTSALMGIAIDKNYIASVDLPASVFINEWSQTDKETITIKSLLQMSSALLEVGDDGWGMYAGTKNEDGTYTPVDNLQYSLNRSFDPRRQFGSYKWNYQNADTQILGEVIERASGQSLYEYAHDNLFSKIGIEADWWTDAFENYMAYCCIDTTTRNFARFGLLYARDGRWDRGYDTGQETQLISKEYVLESTAPAVWISPNVYIKYSYQWWADESGDWFMALGHGSNNIYVHPGLDLVVVRNSTVSFFNDTGKTRATNYKTTPSPEIWDHRDFFLPIVRSAMNQAIVSQSNDEEPRR